MSNSFSKQIFLHLHTLVFLYNWYANLSVNFKNEQIFLKFSVMDKSYLLVRNVYEEIVLACLT